MKELTMNSKQILQAGVLFLLSLEFTLSTAVSQGAAFFRISGPGETKIIDFRTDGSLVWSNSLAGTNYVIQTAALLPGATNWVDYVQVPVTNNLNTNFLVSFHPPAGMALIPAGSFMMGDSLDGTSYALPVHSVYVSAFYMDKYPVTKALWDKVYSWAITNGYVFAEGGSAKATNHPVQTISWYTAMKWCNARSEMEGLTPAYYTSAAQTNVARTVNLDVDNSWVKWNGGYRLPTEAEWEKAARGGLSGLRFPWGNTISRNQANYNGNTNAYAYDLGPNGINPAFVDGVVPSTSPVGYFAPNGYGLYDMAGNVNEWCWDWYEGYGSSPQSDPRGPSTGTYRAGRGGYCGDSALNNRVVNRLRGDKPAVYFDGIGFRSVLSAGQ